MTTDNHAFDLVAADGLRLSYTPIRDWAMLHPELRGTPFQLYAIMRSLVVDKAADQLSRRVTIDQLCWLLPGINGKPTSETAVKDALKVLDRLGLVTNPDSERLVTSTGRGGVEVRRRFQINDLPPDGFHGWRNAWDKLNDYREGWRSNAPDPPSIEHPFKGRNSDHCTDQAKQGETAGRFKGRNSDDRNRNSDDPHRNSDRLTASEQPKRALKKSLKEGSLSPVPTRYPEADPNEPREREDRGEAKAPDPADLIVQAWTESWATSHDGVSHPVKAPDVIRRDARELLAEGVDPDLLCVAAADMATRGWKNLRTHLEHWTPPVRPASGVTKRTPDNCRWCDPFGWYEHASGRDARCPHPDNPPDGHPAAHTRSAA
jgi:hypothetical protein